MRRSGRSSRRRLSLPLTSHGLQIFLSLCGAAASLSVPGASLAARRGPLTRGDGTALVSCLSEPMSSVSSLTYTAAACSSLDRGSHGQRSIYSHLPLGPKLGALHFQCCQLFIVLLVFGRQHFSSHSSSFFLLGFLFSLQVTSRGPPTRISLAIYSHCHLFSTTPGQLGFVRLDLYHT